MSTILKRFLQLVSAAVLMNCGTAMATAYSNLYVFGDSLADSGNAAYFLDNFTPLSGMRTPTPLTQPLIPDFPYASDRLTNGPVWTEYFAASLGLSATSSLTGGSNFAFAGARIGPASSPSSVPGLADQVGMFLGVTGGMAPASALYVVEGGGNDARDVLAAALGGTDPTALIQAYVGNVLNILMTLATAGADEFLLWNVPDIGKIPAILAVDAMAPGVSAVASSLVLSMNQALAIGLTLLPAGVSDGIHYFDAYGALDAMVANPGAFGFGNVTDPCAMSAACIADPSGYLFWDGIHPTTAGHAVMAQLALRAIPEPQTLLLLGLGLIAIAVVRRRAI